MNESTLLPHRRQICYSRSAQSPVEGWTTLSLDGGVWVHFAEGVRIQQLTSCDGRLITVFGECHTAVSAGDAGWILSKVELAGVPQVLAHLGGRFHLIADGVLYRDAGGLLGFFYGENGALASTSLALAGAGRDRAKDRIRHGVGIDWFPGPLTPARGVRRLLPGERFSFLSWQPFWAGLQIARPDGNARDALIEALVAQISAAARGAEEVFVPLTAGLDSRTLLAATLAAGLEPTLFTMSYPGIDRADIEVPALIAARLGLAHRVIAHRPASREALAAADAHSSSLSFDADRGFLASGMWRDFGGADLVLRGGCFEFGRRFYDRYIAGEPPDEPDAAAEYIHRHFPNALLWRHQPTVRAGLRDWWAQTRSHPTPDLVWRDRFYFDQRIGCWLADIEQLLDAAEFRSLCPANAARIYGALDCADPGERTEGHLQRAAISAVWPKLLNFKINPRGRLVERIFKGFRRRFVGLTESVRPNFPLGGSIKE